jgi:hypothetical protein
MASLFITEYARCGTDGRKVSLASIPEEPPLATQAIPITGDPVESATFNPGTTLIRVYPEIPCNVEIGADPVLSPGSRRLAAGAPEYFAVPLGSGLKLIAVRPAW